MLSVQIGAVHIMGVRSCLFIYLRLEDGGGIAVPQLAGLRPTFGVCEMVDGESWGSVGEDVVSAGRMSIAIEICGFYSVAEITSNVPISSNTV